MNLPSVAQDGKYRILVVEDDRNIARLITANLSKAGFDCKHELDGVTGLATFTRFDPHLVLTDIMMPGMSGHELCARIRESSAIPIIMMTAADSDAQQMQGFRTGADDYVPKPFNPQLLVARVIANLRRVYKYNPQSTPDTSAVNQADIPPGWARCEGCGYMGPQDRFDSDTTRTGKQMRCPVCNENNFTMGLG